MADEQDIGYFQDDFDPSLRLVQPDPSMPSELGGTVGDWNPEAQQTFEGSYGSYGEEEAGPVAGPDVVDTSGGMMSGDVWSGILGQGGSVLGDWLGGGSPSLRNAGAMGGDPTQGGSLFPVGRGCGGGYASAAVQRKRAILATVCRNIGKRISAKAIVRFIVKYGAALAAGATGLGVQDLLFLFVEQKGKPARRRGPHLYTVVKRIRAGHRYEAMLSRYGRKTHAHAHRSPAPRARCMFCRSSPCRCRRRKHG